MSTNWCRATQDLTPVISEYRNVDVECRDLNSHEITNKKELY